MTLRTTSIRRQHQAWACLALLGVVAYFVLVPVLELGNPFRFFGSHQMRVLLPLVVLLRILAREFRWDGIVREEVKSKSEKGRSAEEEEKVVVDSCSCRVEEKPDSAEQHEKETGYQSTTTTQNYNSPPVLSPHTASACFAARATPSGDIPPPFSTFSAAPAAESPEALWERARVMVHNVIPDPVEDAEYLNLVFSAAEQGYVPALAKLGDYAFRRGAFVEAYFWTKIAKRRLEMESNPDPQGLKEIDDMLLSIRREWTAAGQPLEFENVYDSFPEERGELGRAFLRLDGGIEVKQTREYLQLLADKGNPDAALFAKR